MVAYIDGMQETITSNQSNRESKMSDAARDLAYRVAQLEKLEAERADARRRYLVHLINRRLARA